MAVERRQDPVILGIRSEGERPLAGFDPLLGCLPALLTVVQFDIDLRQIRPRQRDSVVGVRIIRSLRSRSRKLPDRLLKRRPILLVARRFQTRRGRSQKPSHYEC